MSSSPSPAPLIPERFARRAARGGGWEWRVGGPEGQLHRLDGPAIELADGTCAWWVEGQRHRLDGPAVELADGRRREWWIQSKLHRLDGPAIEYADGHREWFVEGKRHRLDGPAVERADGSCEWWIEGREVEPHEHPWVQGALDRYLAEQPRVPRRRLVL